MTARIRTVACLSQHRVEGHGRTHVRKIPGLWERLDQIHSFTQLTHISCMTVSFAKDTVMQKMPRKGHGEGVVSHLRAACSLPLSPQGPPLKCLCGSTEVALLKVTNCPRASRCNSHLSVYVLLHLSQHRRTPPWSPFLSRPPWHRTWPFFCLSR